MNFSELVSNANMQLKGSDFEYKGLSADTRSLKPGQVFVAIKGPNFDGEEFIGAAVDAGASAVVSTRNLENASIPYVQCDDAIEALADLARAYRAETRACVISITGSCGKTTLKGLLKTVCSLAGACSATQGNLNNHIGVPLTLLNADLNDDYWVIEAGTSSPGEIAYLAEIINADLAILNSIQAVHLEGFGEELAIAREKMEIFRSPATKFKLCHSSCARFDFIASEISNGNLISIDSLPGEEDDQYGRQLLEINGVRILTGLVGRHQRHNIAVAYAAIQALEIDVACFLKAVEEFKGEKGRMQLHVLNGSVLIDDSYNANPSAMCAAIDYLSAYPNSLLVLGGMGELGDFEESAHIEVGRYAKQRDIKKLYALEPHAKWYLQGYGVDGESFAEHGGLASRIKKEMKNDLAILVKGSRFTRMDKVSSALLEGTH